MKSKTIIFLIVVLTIRLNAQVNSVSDQYVLNPMLINPSYAGERGALNIGTFYRMQWIGITGAPETLTLAVDAPFFNNKVGLGFMVINDKIGVTRETQLATDYSYKIDIKEGKLSFGLGVTMMSTKTEWSKLITVDEGDDSYLIDSKNYYVPNFSFGMYYTIKNYYAGFSIPKFVNHKFNFDKNRYSLLIDPSLYTYLFTTGYSFTLSKNINFVPSTLLRYPTGQKPKFDLNAYFSFFNRFWLGASYRNNRTVSGLFQFHIDDQLKLAYSYDYDLGKLGKYSSGSHGIMIRYTFNYRVEAVNPLIF